MMIAPRSARIGLVKEITLYPGEAANPSLSRREGVLFLGVVGLFRHSSGSAWRVVTKLAPPNPGYCHAPGGGEPAENAKTWLPFWAGGQPR